MSVRRVEAVCLFYQVDHTRQMVGTDVIFVDEDLLDEFDRCVLLDVDLHLLDYPLFPLVWRGGPGIVYLDFRYFQLARDFHVFINVYWLVDLDGRIDCNDVVTARAL